MTQKIFQNNKYSYAYAKYVSDTAEDVKKIPVTIESMGSEVYVIENSSTYILDSKKTWHSKNNQDIIVCDCDCVEESTIWGDIAEVV